MSVRKSVRHTQLASKRWQGVIALSPSSGSVCKTATRRLFRGLKSDPRTSSFALNYMSTCSLPFLPFGLRSILRFCNYAAVNVRSVRLQRHLSTFERHICRAEVLAKQRQKSHRIHVLHHSCPCRHNRARRSLPCSSFLPLTQRSKFYGRPTTTDFDISDKGSIQFRLQFRAGAC